MNDNRNPNLRNTRPQSGTPGQGQPRHAPQRPAGQRPAGERPASRPVGAPAGSRRPAPQRRPDGVREARPDRVREVRPEAVRQTRPVQRPERPYTPKKKRSPDDYLIWFLILAVVVLVALVVTFIIVRVANNDRPDTPPVDNPSESGSSAQVGVVDPENNNETTVLDWTVVPVDKKAFVPKFTSAAATVSSSRLNSEAAIMVDMKTGEVVCSLDPEARIYPASLTKIMTAIVACENIRDMYATEKLTLSMVDPLVKAGASRARFPVNTPIPMKDLIYGVILPSGADACVALAKKIAGSDEKFVKLMNEKAAEIGCTDTHFENATGLHHKDHYSTVKDIATMLTYAMNNPFLRVVLSTTEYDTPIPDEVGEDLVLYCIWKGRLYGNEANNSTLFAAKTGYTNEAGNCLASVSRTSDGKEYVIVTVGARSQSGESSKPMPFEDAKYLSENYIK